MSAISRAGIVMMFLAVICGIIGDVSVLMPIKVLVTLFFVIGTFILSVIETGE